jgi:hypothetical protein
MYHKHLRNVTIALGSLLNSFNVSIGKKNVPVSFAAKNRFVAKLKNSQMGVQTFLPRIGFNMEGISYDADRQQQKNQVVVKNGKKSLTPVPYLVDFNVGIYTKSMDEGLEILEQLLPSFTPYYNLRLMETNDLDIVTDVPLALNSVTLQDNWEGSFEGSDLRTILWELSLSAPINLFPTIKDKGPVINTVTLNFGLISDNWYEETQQIQFNGYARLIAEANILT